MPARLSRFVDAPAGQATPPGPGLQLSIRRSRRIRNLPPRYHALEPAAKRRTTLDEVGVGERTGAEVFVS